MRAILALGGLAWERSPNTGGGAMIRLVLEYQAKDEKGAEQLIEVIREIRNEAMKQPGYITGETLVDIKDPSNVLVISTWHTAEQYEAWNKTEPRIKMGHKVDQFIAEPHTESVYGYYLVREGKVWSTV
jgi:heme-degrading monooxygenase HmoA